MPRCAPGECCCSAPDISGKYQCRWCLLSPPPPHPSLHGWKFKFNRKWGRSSKTFQLLCLDMKIWFLPQFITWRSEVSLRYEFYYQPALDRTLDHAMGGIVNNIYLLKLKPSKWVMIKHWASNYLKPNSEVYWIYWKTSGNFSLLTSPPWCFYGQ